MDLITHGFVPYAILTWMRRPAWQRAVAAAGGMAPDADSVFAWASHLHAYAYPLVHRGFSHTLWGAPLLATLVLLLLSRPFWQKRWPRMQAFRWTPAALAPLWMGSFTHLALDAVTITGIPLLWPFEHARWTTNWFFFGIFIFLPFSLFALIQAARGKASDRMIKRVSVILLALLVLAAVVRFVSLPQDREPGSHLTPGPNEWTWYVTRQNETGTLVYATGFLGKRLAQEFLPEPNRTEAAQAIAACRDRPEYIPWKWDLWAPDVVNATRTPDGGWEIHFQDPAQVYSDRHPPYTMPRYRGDDNADDTSVCRVTAEGHATFERARGWMGS